jgi:hypothetical protein
VGRQLNPRCRGEESLVERPSETEFTASQHLAQQRSIRERSSLFFELIAFGRRKGADVTLTFNLRLMQRGFRVLVDSCEVTP